MNADANSVNAKKKIGTCIVAVDVGNSAVKLCVQQVNHQCNESNRDDATLVDYAIATSKANWSQEAVQWVREQVGCRKTAWRIATVHRAAADQLERTIKDLRASDRDVSSDDVIDRISRHDVPMPVRVDQPDRLGIDRLIGAFAAAQRFGAPLVVVDAGSAVTVDWVNADGVFCGGAIMPGLRLQSKALASGTDALPDISWEAATGQDGPGANTVDAIRLGVLTGLAAGIDRLAIQYKKDANRPPSGGDEPPTIVLTGGDAAPLSRYLRGDHKQLPNLVCRGLLDLTKSTS